MQLAQVRPGRQALGTDIEVPRSAQRGWPVLAGAWVCVCRVSPDPVLTTCACRAPSLATLCTAMHGRSGLFRSTARTAHAHAQPIPGPLRLPNPKSACDKLSESGLPDAGCRVLPGGTLERRCVAWRVQPIAPPPLQAVQLQLHSLHRSAWRLGGTACACACACADITDGRCRMNVSRESSMGVLNFTPRCTLLALLARRIARYRHARTEAWRRASHSLLGLLRPAGAVRRDMLTYHSVLQRAVEHADRSVSGQSPDGQDGLARISGSRRGSLL